MISTNEIQKRIILRARQQFNRDMSDLFELINEHNGEISIVDIVAIMNNMEKKDKAFSFFNKKKSGEEETIYESARYVFMYRFMDVMGIDELTAEEFKSFDFANIYNQAFKAEYEEYQKYMFDKFDASFYNGKIKPIYGNKNYLDSDEWENC